MDLPGPPPPLFLFLSPMDFFPARWLYRSWARIQVEKEDAPVVSLLFFGPSLSRLLVEHGRVV